MEFEYFIFFLYPKYSNLIRTRSESENYGYFNYRPDRSGSDKIRPGTDPKNYNYLNGSKFPGPEKPVPDKT